MRNAPVLAITLGCLLLAGCSPSGTPETAEATPPPTDPALESPPGLPAAVSANFRCGDLLVGVDFDNVAETATLSWTGHRRVLPQAIAASGARFADDAGNEFWNKGDEATLTFAGAEPVQCATTEETSPWDDARERGVAFRGIGNEPGWLVEVDGGNAPSLRAQLDYGERNIEASNLDTAPDGSRISGRTAEGDDVSLAIAIEDCSDGMSDQIYPASAELTVGERSYRGCGAWLDR